MSLSRPPTFHRFLPSKPPPCHRHTLRPRTHCPPPLFLPLRSATSIKITASSSSSATKSLPQSAIRRIADKLRSLGFVEDPPSAAASTTTSSPAETLTNNLPIGEIFVPNSKAIPKYRVGHTLDSSWSTPENPVPEPGSGRAISKLNELIGDAKRERKESQRGRATVPTMAELTLRRSELRRLTTVGIRMKQKLKIGKAGVTEGIVNGIHERWRSEEVVKIVCEDVWKLNMKRTHDLLESKTGGMVVWRAGSKIILYRGANYKFPYFKVKTDSAGISSQNTSVEDDSLLSGDESNSSDKDATESARVLAQSSLVLGVGSPNKVRFQLPGEKLMVEEADLLLDSLGPRFTDWWGYDPLPVDADLLPAVVPGFRRPFRLLPYGVKPKLTNDEMTILKRLGRPLPCHFALGRNRNLQGLAASMIKLWEKCEIAKIAVKRGVQNTNSDMMAEELKRLTGGVLISRDKDFIVFYRGKDFLPSSVSSAIEERRRVRMQREKEQRKADSASILPENSDCEHSMSRLSGENGVTNNSIDSETDEKNLKRIEENFERTKMRLSMALQKKARAEELLAELEQQELAQNTEIDKEGVTEEERYMLRKVGLKMKPFLLLGRRGVFDGTVENMHLHWKYRELVKIICGGRNIEEVYKVAHTLEAESCGILIAVESVRNGYAIIVYRGKNYQRPARLRPETLLTKKEAMRRSLVAQRRESLKLHVLKLSRNVEDLQLALDKDMNKSESSDISSNNQLNSNSEVEQQNRIILDDGSHASDIQSVESSVIYPTHKLELTVPEKLEDKLGNGAPNNDWNADSASADKEQPYSYETWRLPLVNNDWESDNESKEKGPVSSHEKALNSYESNKMPPAYNDQETGSEPADKGSVSSYKTAPNSYESKKLPLANSERESDGESSDIVPGSLNKKAPNSYESGKMPTAPLSNKERLILRKHALKMKRCPLLAIGKSNILSGVAKSIKDHFKKYPLVIVNVKGRAKGTSVQEVIFELQQATGALLVSQEPSKIILYRGWGVNLGAGSSNASMDSSAKQQVTRPTVSPELLAAMRLECGLSDNPK
ncbi:hypothetical protein V2J09_000268 [Rumex salicifolius]